jgi:hypothetical protein
VYHGVTRITPRSYSQLQRLKFRRVPGLKRCPPRVLGLLKMVTLPHISAADQEPADFEPRWCNLNMWGIFREILRGIHRGILWVLRNNFGDPLGWSIRAPSVIHRGSIRGPCWVHPGCIPCPSGVHPGSIRGPSAVHLDICS